MIEVVLRASDRPSMSGEADRSSIADRRALWVDVLAPTEDELLQLSGDHDVPLATLQEAMSPRHLPRHEKLGDVVFIVARVYDEEAPPEADSFQTITRKIAMFLSDGCLVTIHRRRLPFLEKLKQRMRESRDPIYLQDVMLEILLDGVETFHAPLEEAELRIHDFEASALEPQHTTVQWRDVFRTKVRVQTIKRLLWHMQNASQKYLPHSQANQPLALELRERVASLSFFAESLDEDLDSLLGVQLALASNRTNDVMRVLTLFSVFFLPITFIVGVYGMNFEHMPELASPYGYAAVWVVIAFTEVVLYLWFRRRGWLGG
ncbi:Magnesium transport protein CorA [Sandaracinus amylolyticus]|nr:Magnesium transport protein CorA [Sandaracinus amylolyticus]